MGERRYEYAKLLKRKAPKYRMSVWVQTNTLNIMGKKSALPTENLRGIYETAITQPLPAANVDQSDRTSTPQKCHSLAALTASFCHDFCRSSCTLGRTVFEWAKTLWLKVREQNLK